MPQLLQHIDAIARQKGRDVLYLSFYPRPADFLELSDFDHEKCRARKTIIKWLDTHGIAWEPCGEFADERTMMPYLGSIYLDIPYDTEDAGYQKVTSYLENPDGSMKVKSVSYWIVPLDIAMKNKHHDEPGFWERWGKDF